MTAVLDWYSRYVVSWVLSQTLELEFFLAAVYKALLQAVREIWNSDQGSHFTSPRYLERLQNENIKISTDGPLIISSPNGFGARSNTKKFT